MISLEFAIDQIGELIGEDEKMLIKGNKIISKNELMELYYRNGNIRNFSLKAPVWYSEFPKKEAVIPRNILTQWQTIMYYDICAQIGMKRDIHALFFSDLDLLVKNDLSSIDVFHDTSALLQCPDLPYKYVEHIPYLIDDNGRYMNDVGDIVEFVREKLQDNFLVSIELDTFFIDQSKGMHGVLRYLVYGFDDDVGQFMCFGSINKSFKGFCLSYSKLNLCYEYAKIVNINAPLHLELYRPLRNNTVNFEMAIKSKEILKNYYLSKNSYNVLQAENKSGRWIDCEEYVGREASEKFVDLLYKMEKGEGKVCYQCIHAFYENKTRLLEQVKKFGDEKKIGYLEDAVKAGNLGRILFLKYRQTKNKKALQRSIAMCKRVLELEKSYFDCLL